jgi:hypothetical protein
LCHGGTTGLLAIGIVQDPRELWLVPVLALWGYGWGLRENAELKNYGAAGRGATKLAHLYMLKSFMGLSLSACLTAFVFRKQLRAK